MSEVIIDKHIFIVYQYIYIDIYLSLYYHKTVIQSERRFYMKSRTWVHFHAIAALFIAIWLIGRANPNLMVGVFTSTIVTENSPDVPFEILSICRVVFIFLLFGYIEFTIFKNKIDSFFIQTILIVLLYICANFGFLFLFWGSPTSHYHEAAKAINFAAFLTYLFIFFYPLSNHLHISLFRQCRKEMKTVATVAFLTFLVMGVYDFVFISNFFKPNGILASDSTVNLIASLIHRIPYPVCYMIVRIIDLLPLFLELWSFVYLVHTLKKASNYPTTNTDRDFGGVLWLLLLFPVVIFALLLNNTISGCFGILSGIIYTQLYYPQLLYVIANLIAAVVILIFLIVFLGGIKHSRMDHKRIGILGILTLFTAVLMAVSQYSFSDWQADFSYVIMLCYGMTLSVYLSVSARVHGCFRDS